MTLTIRDFLKLIWFYSIDLDCGTTQIAFNLVDDTCEMIINNTSANLKVKSTYKLTSSWDKPRYFEISSFDLNNVLDLIYEYIETHHSTAILNSKINIQFRTHGIKVTINYDSEYQLKIRSLKFNKQGIEDNSSPIAAISAADWQEMVRLAFLNTETTNSNLVQLPVIKEKNTVAFSNIGSEIFISGHNNKFFFKSNYKNHYKKKSESHFCLVPNFAILATSKYDCDEEVLICYCEESDSYAFKTSQYKINFPKLDCDDYPLVRMFSSLDGIAAKDLKVLIKDEYVYFNGSDPRIETYDARLPRNLWEDYVSFFDNPNLAAYHRHDRTCCIGIQSDSSNLSLVLATQQRGEQPTDTAIAHDDPFAIEYEYQPDIFPDWNVEARQELFDIYTDYTCDWYYYLSEIAGAVEIDRFANDLEKVGQQQSCLKDIDIINADDAIDNFKNVSTDCWWKDRDRYLASNTYTIRPIYIKEFADLEKYAHRICPAIAQLNDSCRYFHTLILPQ